MPATPDQLLNILRDMGFDTTTTRHEAVFTVAQSEGLHQQIQGGHTKNLFVKDKKSNYFLLVIEQGAKVDLNRLHPIIGAKSRVSFAKAEPLMEYLGVSPGSVTAFSVINDKENRVQLIIDKPLLDHQKINCHPLTNEMTTTICREDLLTFLAKMNHQPQILQISQPISEDGDGAKN